MFSYGLLAVGAYPGVCPTTRVPSHEEAAHPAYRDVLPAPIDLPRHVHHPTYATFVTLATGWCLSPRHRYITEMIQAADAVHRGHHSRYHRFFSGAAWSVDDLYETLALRAVQEFYPTGTIILAVDDTLCRNRGLTIFGAGMHHDPPASSRKRAWVRWGHDWVILSLIIANPPWSPTEVWALPVGLRLYRNRQALTKGKKGPGGPGKGAKRRPPADPGHRTRPELAVDLIERFARFFPGREVIVSGDSAYGGKSVLRHLPASVDLISRVAPNAALYRPAPTRRPEQKGPARKKGDRLPGMADWAADAMPWEELEFDQYGLHASLRVKTIRALYYKAGKDRLLSIVLVRDAKGVGRTRCSTARGPVGMRGRSRPITRAAGVRR